MTINDFVAILLTFLLVCINTYYVYKAWFDPESLRSFLIERQKKLPNWYPLREYALQRLQQPQWLWQIRILSILSSVITITLIIIVVFVVATTGFSR